MSVKVLLARGDLKMNYQKNIRSQRGATLVEAAAALPLFVFIVAGCFAIGGFVEARAQFYEQVAAKSREISAAAVRCASFESEATSVAGNFQETLAKRGYSGTLVITPLDASDNAVSDPESIAKWRLDASLSTTCALCGPMKMVSLFPSDLNATTVIWAENPGCIRS